MDSWDILLHLGLQVENTATRPREKHESQSSPVCYVSRRLNLRLFFGQPLDSISETRSRFIRTKHEFAVELFNLNEKINAECIDGDADEKDRRGAP